MERISIHSIIERLIMITHSPSAHPPLEVGVLHRQSYVSSVRPDPTLFHLPIPPVPASFHWRVEEYRTCSFDVLIGGRGTRIRDGVRDCHRKLTKNPIKYNNCYTIISGFQSRIMIL